MTESAESLEIQLAEAKRQRDEARRALLAHKRLREEAEACLEAVKAAHSKLHGRCNNPICPLRAALSDEP